MSVVSLTDSRFTHKMSFTGTGEEERKECWNVCGMEARGRLWRGERRSANAAREGR